METHAGSSLRATGVTRAAGARKSAPDIAWLIDVWSYAATAVRA